MDYGNIAMNRIICDTKSETEIGADIIVPDSMPDVAKVIFAKSYAYTGESYASKGRVTVSGSLFIEIIYISDEATPKIYTINTKTPFSHQVDVKEINGDSNLCVYARVNSTQYNAQNSRKINIVSNVSFNIFATQYDEKSVDVSCGDIPVKSREISAYNNVLCQRDSFLIEISESVDGAVKLINCCENIISKDIKIISNKVIVKGTARFDTVFEMSDGSLNAMQFSTDFTEVLDVKDIDPDMISSVSLSIKNSETAFTFDEERGILEIHLTAEAVTSAYDIFTYDVLYDAYSPDYEVKLTKSTLNYFELIKRCEDRICVKDYFDISPHGENKICGVYPNVRVNSAKSVNGQAQIDGIVATTLLYISQDENEIFAMSKNIPFSYSFDTESCENFSVVKCNVSVDDISCTPNVSGEAEVKLTLLMDSSVIIERNTDIITSIEFNKENCIDKSDISSITIYFVQPGDTLWNIAKKYHTTTNEIAAVNNIDENADLMIGQRLLIPKR